MFPAIPAAPRYAHTVLEAPGIVRVVLSPGGRLYVQRPGRSDLELEPDDSLVDDDIASGAAPTAGDLIEAWATASDRPAVQLMAAMRFLRTWSRFGQP